MTKTPFTRFVLIFFAAFGVTTSARQANIEEFARRQYESGLAFIANQQYVEAIKDLQGVVDSFPTSTVADNALLRIAQYQLEVAHDLDLARAATDKLLKTFPDTDSAPMGHVIVGRLSLAKERSPSEINAALASFERVSRLYPGSDAVPAAGYFAGEALRLGRRLEEALDRFRQVTMEYPRSVWAARANLAAGYCLVQTDRARNALQGIQWVRQQFPNTAVATDALDLNTIIYRLYVRAPAQPAYAVTGRTIGGEFRDVTGLLVDPRGRILLGHKAGVTIFDARGGPAGSASSPDASAFFLDERNQIVFAKQGTLSGDKLETLWLVGPNRELENIPAIVPTSNGERLVADPKDKAIYRFSAAGKYVAPPFAALPATRLVVNSVDDVAILDKAGKSVTIADRNGRTIGRIQGRGAGFELAEPVDIAFDSLGHLYVLDRGRGSVFVFGPQQRLVTAVTIPDKSPGALTRAEAFGVDAAGRLLVFDDRSKRIQVLQ